MTVRPSLLLVLVTIAVAPAGYAQTCFPGRPLPECRSFAVLELGYSHRLGGALTTPAAVPRFTT